LSINLIQNFVLFDHFGVETRKEIHP